MRSAAKRGGGACCARVAMTETNAASATASHNAWRRTGGIFMAAYPIRMRIFVPAGWTWLPAPGRSPCRACASLAFDGEQGQQTPIGPADLHPRVRRGRRDGGTDATGRAQTRRAPPLLRSEPEIVVWRQDPRRSLVPGLQRFRLAKDHPAAHQRESAVAQFRGKRLSIRIRLSPPL